MKLVGDYNLKENIKNSNEKKLKRNEVFKFELFGFIFVSLIPIIQFITGIHDDEAIKNMLLAIIVGFSMISLLILALPLPKSFESVKRIVELSEKNLNIIIKRLENYGVQTSVQNLKEAEISKSESMTEEDIKETTIYDKEILKAIKESIRLKTISGEIKTLKQYKLEIINFLDRKETINYLYLDDEVTEGTEHTRKLTN